MTNRELMMMLLHTNLDEEVDLTRTIGEVNFKPQLNAQWIRAGGHSVLCGNCGCKVSLNGAKSMDYCFKCGAHMIKDTLL